MQAESLDTNLLQSARRVKAPDGAPISISARRKKMALKGLAYLVFFLVSVIFFTLIKIPDSAIANYILNEANRSSTAYSFTAEKISVRFFPLPHVQIEKLGMEPRFPGAGLPIALDEARIYPNPFTLGASFSADAYKSKIKGAASMNSFLLESEDLDLAKLTPLAQSGLDLKGLVSSLYVQLSMENQRIGTASGEIRLQGKYFFFDPTSFGLPVTLPILNLGDLDVLGTASRGQVRIDRFKLGSPGKDLEVQVASGTIALNDVMLNTRYDFHLLLKPSAALEKAVPLLPSMLSTMATKRADGFFGIKLAGKLSDPVPSIKKE